MTSISVQPPPRLLFLTALAAVMAGALALPTGCAKDQTILPAPDPRRPKEVKTKVDTGPTDCEVIDPKDLPSAVAYPERSIVEARNLSEQGFSKLQRAEDRKKPKLEREQLVTDAVDLFLTALAADPYNVHATYNLAAAYARIDRPQCSLNLLERLVELRKLRSQKNAVEEKLDRLLGRGRYRRKLDPDFRRMRDLDGFRELVKKFCPSLSKNDPLSRC
jgi:hypothetical protein